MYWQETKEPEQTVVPDDVVDMAYGISCRTLPVDHAYALSEALQEALPWLGEEDQAGMHPIHVAESGNGWIRPQEADALLHLSRRTKLVLRVPKHRVGDAEALVGQTLNVAGNELSINKVNLRPLSQITTIFSRYVAADHDGGREEVFLEAMVGQLNEMGIYPKKMLCGIAKEIATPDGPIHTRSLMIAELQTEESIHLQQEGLGPHRLLGCGLFLPHRDIKEVGKAAGEER
jgi:CRISPR-associated protein Cas6